MAWHQPELLTQKVYVVTVRAIFIRVSC